MEQTFVGDNRILRGPTLVHAIPEIFLEELPHARDFEASFLAAYQQQFYTFVRLDAMDGSVYYFYSTGCHEHL
jgi:hypothetical protein